MKWMGDQNRSHTMAAFVGLSVTITYSANRDDGGNAIAMVIFIAMVMGCIPLPLHETGAAPTDILTRSLQIYCVYCARKTDRKHDASIV